jgi:hypothetical protein
MRIITCCLALIFQLTTMQTTFAQSNAVDAYEVLNKSIAAIGGKAYLQNINTLYTDFKTEMEGRPINWVVKEMLPNKGSFKIVYQDRVVYENRFNGETGYELVGGEKKAMDKDGFKDKTYKKNIFNELDYLDSTLWKIALVGEEKVAKEPCYKIKASLVDGTVKHLYFSKASFYMLKEEKVINADQGAFETVLFSGFKKFGDLIFYTEMKMGTNGQYQTAKLEKLEVNKGVDNKDFN